MVVLSFSPSSQGQQAKPDSHYFSFLSLNSAVMTLYMTANSIGDGILLYRCYHLWAAKKSIIATPIILCVFNFLLFSSGLIIEGVKDRDFDPPFTLTSVQDFFGISVILALVFSVVTLATNILLTALIAFRILRLMRLTQKYGDADLQIRNKQIHHLIVIILESGSVYPITVLLCVSLVFFISPVKLVPIAAQALGIAPTLIMVRVELGLSIESDDSRNTVTFQTLHQGA